MMKIVIKVTHVPSTVRQRFHSKYLLDVKFQYLQGVRRGRANEAIAPSQQHAGRRRQSRSSSRCWQRDSLRQSSGPYPALLWRRVKVQSWYSEGSNGSEGSIGYTPKGTDIAWGRLTEVVRETITIGNAVRNRSTNLRRRPIDGGGELIRNSIISKL